MDENRLSSSLLDGRADAAALVRRDHALLADARAPLDAMRRALLRNLARGAAGGARDAAEPED